jgi:hypothetical protein
MSMAILLGVVSDFHWTLHVIGFSCAFVVADSCRRVCVYVCNDSISLLYRRRIFLFHYVLLQCRCQNVSHHFQHDLVRMKYFDVDWRSFSSSTFIYPSIYGSMALLLDLGRFFSFLIICTVGRTPWTGDQPVARPLPTHRTTQTQN